MTPAGRTIRLPCYGITITLVKGNVADKPGSGTITSDLHATGTTADRQYNAAIDGLKSLILAHACSGVDVESPAYVQGVETAVEAIANHVCLNAARPQIGSAPLVGQPAPCSGDQQVLMTKRTKWTSAEALLPV